MKAAYTLIEGWGTPHLDVGPTYESEDDAIDAAEESDFDYEVVPVVCHVKDFTHGFGQFMIRTDGIHEVSFVVDTYDSETDWHPRDPMNCELSTRLVGERED